MAASMGRGLLSTKLIASSFSSIREVLTCYSWRHFRAQQIIDVFNKRSLHTTIKILAGEKWRAEKGYAQSGTEYGPLTDLPDWSYADGRPAPPSKGQVRRKEQERETAMQIEKLSKEIMFTKNKQTEVFSEEVGEIENKMHQQLRSKGNAWKGSLDNKRRRKRKL